MLFNTEPIDIYTSATYLPENMRADADKLWTEPRMNKLIDALLKNGATGAFYLSGKLGTIYVRFAGYRRRQSD